MFVFKFPQSRHFLGIAAMALTMAAFSVPASAAGPDLSAGAQHNAAIGEASMGTSMEGNMNAPVRLDDQGQGSNAAADRYEQNLAPQQGGTEPAVDIQMQNDDNAAEEMRNARIESAPKGRTSYSGTRLYNGDEANAGTTVNAPQRTARASTGNKFAIGPNTMRALNGGTVTFNE